MAITITQVDWTLFNVVANNDVSINMPLFATGELFVTYTVPPGPPPPVGEPITRLPAIYGLHYTLTLAVDVQSFVFRATAELVTVAGGATNTIHLHRGVAYTTSFTENDGFIRKKISNAIDRIMMRFQQIAAYVKSNANRSMTISGQAPPTGLNPTLDQTVLHGGIALPEEGDLWIRVI